MTEASTQPSAPDSATSTPLPWWKKPWVPVATLFLAAVLSVYGLIYVDVVLRARESYREGEKHMDWAAHPGKKQAYYEARFKSLKSRLDSDKAKNKLGDDAYARELEAMEFDKARALEESSLKYAYQWFKDTYDLFSPPESRWVRKARERAPEALSLWKKELDGLNSPYQDHMFE